MLDCSFSLLRISMVMRFVRIFWKERGTGDIRILKHKESKQERVVMRQEKTFKLILNHIINPMTVLVTFLVWSESVERKCWK